MIITGQQGSSDNARVLSCCDVSYWPERVVTREELQKRLWPDTQTQICDFTALPSGPRSFARFNSGCIDSPLDLGDAGVRENGLQFCDQLASSTSALRKSLMQYAQLPCTKERPGRRNARDPLVWAFRRSSTNRCSIGIWGGRESLDTCPEATLSLVFLYQI